MLHTSVNYKRLEGDSPMGNRTLQSGQLRLTEKYVTASKHCLCEHFDALMGVSILQRMNGSVKPHRPVPSFIALSYAMHTPIQNIFL